MKKNLARRSKAWLGLLVVTCLMMGLLAGTTAFAATGDIPAKGWDRLVGGGKTDVFNDIVATRDGSAVSVGTTVPDGSSEPDGLIVKTDDRGTVVWSKQVGGYLEDGLNGLIELADGSILAVGYARSSQDGDVTGVNQGARDGWLIKFDADGQKLWDKLIGGTDSDMFADVIATEDGGFLAVGNSYSSLSGQITDANNGSNTSDGYIVKFDASGNKQWDNLFGGPEYDFFYGVAQLGDGGYVVVGNANGGSNGVNFGGEITDRPSIDQLLSNDALAVKFNQAGAVVWNDLFGSSMADAFYGVTATSDGGFLAAGSAGALDGDVTTGEASEQGTALAVKFNAAGDTQWNRSYSLGGIAASKAVVETPCGNYIAAGSFFGEQFNDGFIANIGPAGNLISFSIAGGSGSDWFNALTIGPDRQIVAAGQSTSSQSGSILDRNNGGQDGLLVYFGQSRYFVSFEENGGTAVPNQVVAYGNQISPPADPTKTGYRFTGWCLDENCTVKFSNLSPITRDTILYASWEKIYNTVTFVGNGGTATADQSIAFGDLLPEPAAPSKTGHTFEGWHTDPGCTNPWDFATDKVQSPTTLYAKWSVNQYTVSFNTRGGSSVGSLTADYDTVIGPPSAPTKTGYSFAGWYKESICLTPWDFNTDLIKGDMTLYAKWTANTYSIKFRGNGASSGTMTSMGMTYNVSKNLTRNAYKKTGCSFLGWSKSATGPVAFKNMAAVKNLTAANNGSVTLYAKWGSPITSVQSAGYNKVKITWATAGSATSYRIYRATSASGKYTLVYKARSTQRSWTNTGLATGKTYYYKIYPVALGKVYKHGAYMKAKPIPGTPSVKLTKVSSKSIRISWTGVAGTTKYQIYRATSKSGTYSLVYTASSKARYWTNTGLTKGKTYYYKVRSYHLEGKTKIYGKISLVKYLKL